MDPVLAMNPLAQPQALREQDSRLVQHHRFQENLSPQSGCRRNEPPDRVRSAMAPLSSQVGLTEGAFEECDPPRSESPTKPTQSPLQSREPTPMARRLELSPEAKILEAAETPHGCAARVPELSTADQPQARSGSDRAQTKDSHRALEGPLARPHLPLWNPAPMPRSGATTSKQAIERVTTRG